MKHHNRLSIPKTSHLAADVLDVFLNVASSEIAAICARLERLHKELEGPYTVWSIDDQIYGIQDRLTVLRRYLDRKGN